MEHDIREPKHVFEQPAPVIPMLAWGLVAFAMLLAALVAVAGIAGAVVAEQHPPTPTQWITPGPDVIRPPASLERPCQPLFQRCEVAQ